MGEGCLQFLKDAQIAQKESKVTFCNESYSKLVQKNRKKTLLLSSLIWSDTKVQQN